MISANVFAHVAVAADQSSSSDTFATLLAATIGGAATFIAAVVAAWSSVLTAKRQGKYQQMQYSTRQLSELYGPLQMLRGESKELRSKIGPAEQDLNDPVGWRLVDHIVDISNKPSTPDYKIVEVIISINKRIADTMKEKGGLSIDAKPPDSFSVFLAHAELLEESWRTHISQEGRTRTPFPRNLDQDIDKAVRTLRKRLGEP
jgi:hypothetical protein